jgi:hypothetical protein
MLMVVYAGANYALMLWQACHESIPCTHLHTAGLLHCYEPVGLSSIRIGNGDGCWNINSSHYCSSLGRGQQMQQEHQQC